MLNPNVESQKKKEKASPRPRAPEKNFAEAFRRGRDKFIFKSSEKNFVYGPRHAGKYVYRRLTASMQACLFLATARGGRVFQLLLSFIFFLQFVG